MLAQYGVFALQGSLDVSTLDHSGPIKLSYAYRACRLNLQIQEDLGDIPLLSLSNNPLEGLLSMSRVCLSQLLLLHSLEWFELVFEQITLD